MCSDVSEVVGLFVVEGEVSCPADRDVSETGPGPSRSRGPLPCTTSTRRRKVVLSLSHLRGLVVYSDSVGHESLSPFVI